MDLTEIGWEWVDWMNLNKLFCILITVLMLSQDGSNFVALLTFTCVFI
jgi:hypothetical protein